MVARKVTKACREAAQPSPAKLVEQQHQEERKKAACRSKNKDSLEKSVTTKVAKCLRDNCGNLSEDEQRQVRIDGLTTEERLTKDKHRECDGEKVIFSKFYFQKWRDVYSKAVVEHDALDPVSDDAPIDPKLLAAVQASRQHGGCRQLMAQWIVVRKGLHNQSRSVVCSHMPSS